MEKKINFVTENELKSSRIYYEMQIPPIVNKALFVITMIFVILVLFAIFAPYNVVVKANAEIRSSENVAYITPLASGIVKEKLFASGDFVNQDDELYILENDYIYKGIEAAEVNKNEILKSIEKYKMFLSSIKCYEKNKTFGSFSKTEDFSEFEVLVSEIKKLELEYEKAKNDYETEEKLFPQSTSRLNVENARKLADNAKLNLESYVHSRKSAFSENLKSEMQNLNENESNISRLKTELSKTIIKSPVSGFAEELVYVSKGESIVSESRIAKIIPESFDEFSDESNAQETEKGTGKIGAEKVFIQVSQEDIADLKIGMEFHLSFAKYPSSEYSSAKGKITFVPKDLKLAENGESFYQVTGILDSGKLKNRRSKNEIFLVQGMKATCKILTRKEPLYLFLAEKLGFEK